MVKKIDLIHTRLAVRGQDNTPSNPPRLVDQYWTPEGQLVFEKDPFDPNAWAVSQLAKDLGIESAASAAHLVSMVTSQFHELQTLLREKDAVKQPEVQGEGEGV